MVLVVTLAILLLLFLAVRHHVGVPFLAMIAGVAIFQVFGAQFAQTLSEWIPAIDPWWAERALYFLFVSAMPIILYFRVGKSGLFGVMRIIESIIFAVLMTILLAGPLSEIFNFDNTARELANIAENIRGVAMIIGTILAYVDVFFYRSS